MIVEIRHYFNPFKDRKIECEKLDAITDLPDDADIVNGQIRYDAKNQLLLTDAEMLIKYGDGKATIETTDSAVLKHRIALESATTEFVAYK